MSTSANNQSYLKLPPISSIDLNGAWLPEPQQQEQKPQWKSPSYHYSMDISFNYNSQNNSTLPIMQAPHNQLHQKIEVDINTVVQQCNTLSDKIVMNKNDFVNSRMDNLDDMIHSANEVLNALLRLRKHQLLAAAAADHSIEPTNTNTNTTITSTSSSVTRQRRRGKRPAFQGRCHSCNISETPEWRRGPDGARTLCNACGLHYAKLSRKQQEQTRQDF